MAPRNICPSAPMFHNLTVLIIAIPKPARIRGIALFNDELMLLKLPTESLSIRENTSIGFCPCKIKIIEPIINAIKSPIKKEYRVASSFNEDFLDKIYLLINSCHS